MQTATTYVDHVAAQVNDIFAKVEKDSIDAIRSWTRTVEASLPETVRTADPVESLPRPDAVAQIAFGFGRKVIDVQTDVARSVATAVEPVLERLGLVGEPATPTTTTTTTKAPGTKTTKATKAKVTRTTTK